MGKILGIMIVVFGCFSLGLWAATIMGKFLQKPGPPQLDECKNALRTNMIIGWASLILSVFAFLPLKFDLVPLRGFSTIVAGFILLGISSFFLTYRSFRLQGMAVMALAREYGNKLTKVQIIEHLKVGEERANALIKYLLRNNLVMITSEEGSIGKELDEEAKEKKLDRLNEKLRKISGDREWKSLRELRALRNTFREKGAWASEINDYSVSEILSRVEELFNNCIYSLERAYELWSAADAIEADATRQAMQRKRDEIISDVQKSIEQLGKNLIDIQDTRTEHEPGTKLTQIREQMTRQIEIAKKVRERIDGMMIGEEYSIKES